MGKCNKQTFFESIMTIPFSGCWIWLKYCKTTPSPNYMLPWMSFENKAQAAARVSWKVVDLAKKYGVHRKSMSRILNGGHWRQFQLRGLAS